MSLRYFLSRQLSKHVFVDDQGQVFVTREPTRMVDLAREGLPLEPVVVYGLCAQLVLEDGTHKGMGVARVGLETLHEPEKTCQFLYESFEQLGAPAELVVDSSVTALAHGFEDFLRDKGVAIVDQGEKNKGHNIYKGHVQREALSAVLSEIYKDARSAHPDAEEEEVFSEPLDLQLAACQKEAAAASLFSFAQASGNMWGDLETALHKARKDASDRWKAVKGHPPGPGIEPLVDILLASQRSMSPRDGWNIREDLLESFRGRKPAWFGGLLTLEMPPEGPSVYLDGCREVAPLVPMWPHGHPARSLAQGLDIRVSDLERYLRGQRGLHHLVCSKLFRWMGLDVSETQEWSDGCSAFDLGGKRAWIARGKFADILDVYDRASHGGDHDFSIELVSDQGDLSEAYRFVLVGYGHQPMLMAFPRGTRAEKLLDAPRRSLAKNSLINFQGPYTVDASIFRAAQALYAKLAEAEPEEAADLMEEFFQAHRDLIDALTDKRWAS